VDKFGFIAHPRVIEDMYREKALRLLPKPVLQKAMKWIPPFVVSEIKGLRSRTGQEIGGILVGCFLLPAQMLKLDPAYVLKKITAACRVAEKRGARIIGLGGYTSIAGDKGYTIARDIKTGITTGSSYTAWLTLEGVMRSAQNRGMDLSKSTVAIIGATGGIGALCTKWLCNKAAKIIIVARHIDRLEKLKGALSQTNCAQIAIEMDAHKAVKGADIVIVTTSAPDALLDINEFKTGSIVCDVSVPHNVGGDPLPGKGVKLIKGGLARLPSDAQFGIDISLPGNVIFGCIAETMLLTLEGRFEDYSLGDNIDPAKLDEMAAMAKKHGFEVAL
jgi:fatty aldehyde-generating acyl-ACP reductase